MVESPASRSVTPGPAEAPFAALLGIPLLGEWPSAATLIAIVGTTAGVALAAGAFDGWWLPQRQPRVAAR